MKRKAAEQAGLVSGGSEAVDLGEATVAQTLAALHVEPEHGLAADEVRRRRAEYGYNEVPAPKTHPFRRFLGKFWGLSAWMLEIIIVLSAVLGRYAELAVVSLLLVVNAVIGFEQERRSSAVVDTLRQRLQVEARVCRDGNWQFVAARDLVPGDIVRVRQGDIVPADLRLLAGTLSVDQSTLTGESADVAPVAGDVLASGSVIRRGEGNAVVILTGTRTLFGRTTELVQQAKPKLHIDAVVATVVRWLFVIVGTLLVVVLVMAWVRGLPLADTLPLLLVLLMSAVPVALPVMFTTSMAVGAKQLARHGVLVTRLSATEDAASMDVLCVDKTGTLTLNQLTVAGVVPWGDASEADVLAAGALASQEANQDPIDLAFLAAGRERGAESAAVVVSFAPFDPASRRTEALVEVDGRRVRYVKGAVRSVAELCGLEPVEIDALLSRVGDASAKGYRTLAVAAGPESGVLVLVGLVTLSDPLRPDAAQLIATLAGLGVSVKMLTGDALPVAQEIAHAVGLGSVRRAADLRTAEQGGPRDLLADADGLAEVYPEDKYLVVRQLQDSGHVTGMTGDGVNDAPALRQAEVGIAVASATDVAKSAASVVLTEPGLANIVSLVQEGRIIYQRILTWIINKISRTILKAAFVAIPFVITGKFLVSAFGMLLLVFLTDFAKIALATDPVSPSDEPETWHIGGYVATAVALGLAMVVESLVLLYVGWTRLGLSTDDALYSFSLLTLLYFAVFSIVSARERRQFWRSRPGRALVAALTAVAATGTALTYLGVPGLAPLPWTHVALIMGFSLICCLGVNDTLKLALIRRWVPTASRT